MADCYNFRQSLNVCRSRCSLRRRSLCPRSKFGLSKFTASKFVRAVEVCAVEVCRNPVGRTCARFLVLESRESAGGVGSPVCLRNNPFFYPSSFFFFFLFFILNVCNLIGYLPRVYRGIKVSLTLEDIKFYIGVVNNLSRRSPVSLVQNEVWLETYGYFTLR